MGIQQSPFEWHIAQLVGPEKKAGAPTSDEPAFHPGMEELGWLSLSSIGP